MSILTAEEVTNWYLYGSVTPPANIADESLIRPQNVPPLEISVDGKTEYRAPSVPYFPFSLICLAKVIDCDFIY